MPNTTDCKKCGRVLSINISWSRLRTHMSCKQAGYLGRSKAVKKTTNQRNFFPGTVTDRVVRDWLSDDPYSNPGIMGDMVESIVMREQEEIETSGKQLRWKDPSDRDFVIRECQKAVTLIENDLNQLVLPYDYDVDFSFRAPIQAKHPKTGQPETISLNGFMDIIVRDDEQRFRVYDVKHTVYSDYWKKTKGQLMFYDLAVEVMFGAPTVETGLLQPLIEKEPFKKFVVSDNERTVLLTHVLAMADDIWNENYEPNMTNEFCGFCDVKHACSKFKPVVKPDGRKKMSLLG